MGRFYYSTDGMDVHGPVTEAELRLLLHDNVISAESFLCREGEDAWEPVNPAAHQYASPVVPPPYVPSGTVSPSRAPRLFGALLNGVAGFSALAAASGAALLSHPSGDDPTSLAYRLGVFAGALLFITLVPSLIALLAKGITRTIIRTTGMVLLGVLGIVGQLRLSPLQIISEAKALGDQQSEEARKEIAAKGYYSGNGDQSEQSIEKLKGQLTDNSESSRIGRDILTVHSDLLAKVKASDAIEQTCNFALETVKTPDDLAKQSADIGKLRDAQLEVVSFLQNYDQHCRDAMSHDNIGPLVQSQVISGARGGAHVDLLIVLWQDKARLSDDHKARFDFLQKNWGQWELKDGKVLFTDDVSLAAYKGLAQALEDDVEKVRATQKQIFQ